MLDATSNESEPSTTTTNITVQWSHHCRHFEFDEILSATEHFNDSLEIGRGGFGRVYKGKINNGWNRVVAAIKRLDIMSNQGATEFQAEVEMLSKLRHYHLVSLIGYCKHKREMILVYEYMPNGTLEDLLHKIGTPLSWCQRLNICIGAARGLDYLHTGTEIEFGIIHRDIKCSNILLNKSWAAKVSDFGLAKITPTNQPSSSHVSTLVKGTFGYLDPHYFSTGRLTMRSDVYSFGVVLLEVLCRRRPLDNSFELGMATWAQDSIKAGRLMDMVDSDIRSEVFPKCLKQYARIVERCLMYDPKHRPSMAEVVCCLENVLALQERPNTNLLQSVGKTISTWFHFTRNGQNSELAKYEGSMPKREEELYKLPSNPKVEDLKECSVTNPLIVFAFEEIKKMTANFRPERFLGEGGFGSVYKGFLGDDLAERIPPGISVAVKVLDDNGFQGHREWLAEINYLGQLSHPNLVKLFGYCCEDEHRVLIYEYMARGSVENHLFRRKLPPLPWQTRMKIAFGAAKGLAFLHDAEQPVIYRDFKTSNVLLDQDYNAKLSDFGLARDGPVGDISHVSTRIMGTHGYAAPEYVMTGHLTLRCDVYSYGVVLLELLTGRRSMDKSRPAKEQNLVEWARPFLKEKKKLLDIADPKLGGYPVKGFKKAAMLANQCLNHDPKARPLMRDIVDSLEPLQQIAPEV